MKARPTGLRATRSWKRGCGCVKARLTGFRATSFGPGASWPPPRPPRGCRVGQIAGCASWPTPRPPHGRHVGQLPFANPPGTGFGDPSMPGVSAAQRAGATLAAAAGRGRATRRVVRTPIATTRHRTYATASERSKAGADQPARPVDPRCSVAAAGEAVLGADALRGAYTGHRWGWVWTRPPPRPSRGRHGRQLAAVAIWSPVGPDVGVLGDQIGDHAIWSPTGPWGGLLGDRIPPNQRKRSAQPAIEQRGQEPELAGSVALTTEPTSRGVARRPRAARA